MLCLLYANVAACAASASLSPEARLLAMHPRATFTPARLPAGVFTRRSRLKPGSLMVRSTAARDGIEQRDAATLATAFAACAQTRARPLVPLTPTAGSARQAMPVTRR